MAALPYMQLYVADYLADTAHLTTEEHGAYLLLLFSYWQTGKPLRADRLASVARLSNERWTDVERTLSEFFHVRGGIWTHFRVEADLEKVAGKQKKSSDAGKASAKARALAKQELEEQSATDVATNASTSVERTYQRNVNHTRSRDTETDTEAKQSKSKSIVASSKAAGSKTIALADLVRMGVNEKHARDWLAIRKVKRAPLTETAMDGIMREAAIAGITIADAIRHAAENGWQGFKASWLQQGQQRGGVVNRQQQIEDMNNAVVEQVRQEQLSKQQGLQGDLIDLGEVIDVTGERIA